MPDKTRFDRGLNRTTGTVKEGLGLQGAPGPKPQPASDAGNIRVTLARYVIHAEDDGWGGNGIDLYMGYMGAPAGGMVQVMGPKLANVHGTTQVRRGMTTGNGAGPRNVHPLEEVMFEVAVPPAGTAIRLSLIESDETTALIKQAFDQAQVPRFDQREAVEITTADLQQFFTVPFAPIMALLKGANTDDDYGHWNFNAMPMQGGEVVRVKAYGSDNTHADPGAIDIPRGGSGEVRLQYIDNENDIEAILRIDRT